LTFLMQLHSAATYGGLLSEGRAALQSAGIPSAALDARLLLQHVIGWSWEKLLTDEDEIAAPGEITRYVELIGKRLAHVPVAQILGHKEFMSLDFEVCEATLIPRPDSECLVETALKLLPPDAKGRILDLGTGSGCLLISVLKERPNLLGVGVDFSAGALEVAKRNADRLGVGDRAAFVEGDWGAALEGGFAVILANPPYLTEEELKEAEPEVREREPASALVAGPDGLAAYRALAPQFFRLLAPGGFAVVEIAPQRVQEVVRLLTAAGLDSARTEADLAGRPRLVLAQKPNNGKELTGAKKGLESAAGAANVRLQEPIGTRPDRRAD
jgi:release factor glutamine methyltransferase